MPTPDTTELVLSKIVSALSLEGFYVHRLDTGDQVTRLYQIRKEQVFIGMSASSVEIVFDCRDEDAIFVNTLVYEVLGELEATMRKLQKLTDKTSIGKKIFDKEYEASSRKKGTLKNIHPNAIEIDLKAETKPQIIGELVDLLIKSGQLKDKEKNRIVNELLEREKAMSTGMQYGIAIPHAKTDAVGDVVCAVGLKKKGMDFESLDGELSKIFVMILSPRGAAGPHIRFMADISQLLMDERRRARLISAKSSEKFFQILTEST